MRIREDRSGEGKGEEERRGWEKKRKGDGRGEEEKIEKEREEERRWQ